MTFAYGVETFGGHDDAFLKKISGVVKKSGGKVYLVKFFASDDALKKRIADPSRKHFKKLRDYKTLQILRKKYRMDAAVPFAKSIIIDTTTISPRKAAKLILKKNELSRLRKKIRPELVKFGPSS